MNEEVKKLVSKIVKSIGKEEDNIDPTVTDPDERYNRRTPLTAESIQAKFSVEAEVARNALVELTEEWALNIDADGNFRYKPPHPPVRAMLEPDDSPRARKGPEPVRTTNPDIRPYQQDLQRILFSSAFRRLAGVTQVFETRRGHMLHNRLTHTVKAGHIARAIASRLPPFDGLWPDVTEAAALAHDLGHPPFGHAGEKALDQCVTNEGLTDGFEGNAQTFRILTKLSKSKAGQPGLNLTRRVLNAVLKYPWLRDGNPQYPSKWSVYGSEKDEFKWVRNGSVNGKKSLRPK
jgi:dGTP triphosphohydrolase